MSVAQGINKTLRVKKQVTLGTLPGATGAQLLRRRTATFQLTKATYENDEIASHQQSTGATHGVRQTAGRLAGLISAGTYSMFWATALRKDFVAGVNSTALTNVTAQATDPQFTRAAGSFLTDGFKVGDVIRWAGWTTTGAVNNARNFFITALAATTITGIFLDATTAGAKAAGDSVTATVQGKKTMAPLTGHTDDIFTFEEYFSDIVRSELFPDCKLQNTTVTIPPTGNVTVDFDFMGRQMTPAGAAYFTTPTAETTTAVMASITGVVLVDGVVRATITGAKFTIAEGVNADPVVGSNILPDLFRGRIRVTGDFSSYYENGGLTDSFNAATPLNLILVVAEDSSPTANCVVFNMGRIKLGSADKDDGEKGIIKNHTFVAELNSAGGAALANDQTIMSIQDTGA